MRTLTIPKEPAAQRRKRIARFMCAYSYETKQACLFRAENYRKEAKFYRVWNSAVILFVERHRNCVTLRRIKVSPELRGKGHATRALGWLCALADEHEVAITGIVRPFGVKGLNREQLTAWYRRHGFKVSKDETMYRSPKIGEK
jgi:GNAT superfamily N-acetyltransferase